MDEQQEIILQSNFKLSHPFAQKTIVFTGALSTMTRSEAAKRVKLCEAFVSGAVTTSTDFVILGKQRNAKSAKQLVAERYIVQGVDIQILNEEDFLWLLAFENK